ncbi:MAG: bifunctional diguanylate cyclase/phosphodiesterase [Bauldia sp.]|nr:bifunctional diguanylate cyclase/phosphodiesterase [Bauldia sp.]
MLALDRGGVLPVRFIALGVILVGLGAVAAVTAWSATRSDTLAIQNQTRLVAHLLEAETDIIVHDQESVALWDDAVVKTKLAFDYAWVDENLGVWMYDYFGHDRTFVLDEAGRAIYGMADGQGAGPGVVLALPQAVAEMAARVRAGAPVEAEVAVVEGRPAIVSAMPIVPSSTAIVQAPGTELLFASVRFLDQTFVAELAASYLLAGARFAWRPETRGGEVAYPLGSDTDVDGYLIWTPERPGSTMLRETAPWLGLTFAVFAGLIVLLARGAARSYRALVAGGREFRHQALHDTMTGLPNRAALARMLAEILRPEGGTGTSLLMLDLDRFKNVNDAFGHPAGDRVIRETGARIGHAIRTTDTVFRLGGDEFAVLFRTNGEAALAELSCRLIAAVGQPLQLPEGLVSVGVSIGAATAPAGGTPAITPTELMRQADIALYKAKAEGRNLFRLFTEELGQDAVARQRLEEDLRAAIGRDELDVVFQPVRAARSNAITGVEALCRWVHPERGEVPPSVFIPLAEETGLILPLGEFVLRETCRAIVGWAVPAAINVSALELRQGDYPARLLAILRESRIAIDQIELEVTESVIVSEEDQSGRAIRALREAGFRIAIDDFGTGYSSLRYLRSAALHRVKIDRSFLVGIESSSGARSIVRGIVDLAHAIGLSVTAEGVETQAHRDFLLRCGCDELQGFLVGRPADAAETAALPGVLPGSETTAAAS